MSPRSRGSRAYVSQAVRQAAPHIQEGAALVSKAMRVSYPTLGPPKIVGSLMETTC